CIVRATGSRKPLLGATAETVVLVAVGIQRQIGCGDIAIDNRRQYIAQSPQVVIHVIGVIRSTAVHPANEQGTSLLVRKGIGEMAIFILGADNGKFSGWIFG